MCSIYKDFLMNNILNILRFNKQKIPSSTENSGGLVPEFLVIPRKTDISGHFHLIANIIYSISAKTECYKSLIIN